MSFPILLTNDDGIAAEGLRYLWLGLRKHYPLSLVAPSQERSGSAAAITLNRPLHPRADFRFGTTPAWHLDGTPADCVKIAFSALLDAPPRYVISGINRGSNAGRNLLYSGTVGAAIEAAHRGVSAIAISCVGDQECQFAIASCLIAPLLNWIEAQPLPRGCLLNVNIPRSPTLRGIRLVRQGYSYWVENLRREKLDDGQESFFLGGKHLWLQEWSDSDVQALEEGYITLVPICADDLTHYGWLDQQRSLLCQHEEALMKQLKEALSSFDPLS